MRVVARRRTVVAALAVFIGALVIQEAFGMIALTWQHMYNCCQFRMIAGMIALTQSACMNETAGVGAVVLALYFRDSGAIVALPTVLRLNRTN